MTGCATPLRPSGGPEDRTPPELIASTPAAGAVHVTDRRLVLTFSERVDEASLRRALTIAPAPARPPDVRVRGRDVEVVMPDSLQADITYVLTLGTDLRDLRGVAIAAPVTLAFATGARIDQGRLSGSVRSAGSGRVIAGASILAYRLGVDSAAVPPDPRIVRADYRTQTGTDGAFALMYLRPGPYFVVSLDDRNRDGLAGAGEAFAAPPTRAAVAVDTGDAPMPLALYATRVDTTGPALRGAGVSQAGVVSARFDEPVRLQAGAEDSFVIEDSATARLVPISSAWIPAAGAREVALAADPGPTRHTLRLTDPGVVTDSSGNAAVVGSVSFAGPPAGADTARPRAEALLPEASVTADSAYTLRPDEAARVRFSGPIDSIEAASRIVARDPTGAVLPLRLLFDNPTTVRLEIAASEFTVTVDDSTTRRRYRRLPAAEMGGITGRLDDAGASTVLVEAYPDGPSSTQQRPYVTSARPDGTFSLAGLPPGSYRVRFLKDLDRDGLWDGGQLAPYEPPEPLSWLTEAARVRARWDTDLGTVRWNAGGVSAEGAVQDG